MNILVDTQLLFYFMLSKNKNFADYKRLLVQVSWKPNQNNFCTNYNQRQSNNS